MYICICMHFCNHLHFGNALWIIRYFGVVTAVKVCCFDGEERGLNERRNRGKGVGHFG